jgi:hypothetical protein
MQARTVGIRRLPCQVEEAEAEAEEATYTESMEDRDSTARASAPNAPCGSRTGTAGGDISCTGTLTIKLSSKKKKKASSHDDPSCGSCGMFGRYSQAHQRTKRRVGYGRHDQKGPTRHATRTESSTTGQIQDRASPEHCSTYVYIIPAHNTTQHNTVYCSN